MDQLSFQIVKANSESMFKVVAVPYINGQSLIDIIKSAELNYDKSLAGSYDGIRPDILLYELTHCSIHNTSKSRILECECGVDGCWSLLMTITEEKDTVIWNNFQQVQEDSWDYAEVSKFIFDKSAYQEELDKLK